MNAEHFDVLVVGAGISGIGAGYHLQTECPQLRYAILEGRDAIGGTWDLFRYPGIRSDSDMFTLGFPFKPWKEAKAIADGPDILNYLRQTASEYGIDRHIRFGHRVVRAAWSTAESRWTLEIEHGAARERRHLSCSFLYLCSGYYSYAAGYTPEFSGRERFKGRIVHPQEWPQDLDYAGKRVVVVGSGATAVTLVPAMADAAAHVTMLQRSPSYVMSLPARDKIADALRRWLPEKAAHGITRWKNVALSMLIYEVCRRRPEFAKRVLRKGVAAALGPDYDVDTHFGPRYKPWEQRLCLVPNADLFRAIRKGRASVVTDHIEHFTERGIRLKSGRELEADIIITATGLQLVAMGGIQLAVDGRPVEPAKTLSYKGVMIADVPNFAFTLGYINASWTLRADLVSRFVCRLLRHMFSRGYRQCVPHNVDADLHEEPLVDFSSGYFQRALDQLPKQGSRAPWRLHQNYVRDLITLKFGSLDDGALRYSRGAEPAQDLRRAA